MAKKISELNQLQYNDLANDDYFQIIDGNDPSYGNTGTNKRMLVGDFKQAIFISPTLTGHVQLPQQSGQNLGDNSALTLGMGDARYGQSFYVERAATLLKNNNTLEDVLPLTLPSGKYHIDILLGSNNAAGAAKFAFVHDRDVSTPQGASTIKLNLVEQVGQSGNALLSYAHVASNVTQGSDNRVIADRVISATTQSHIYRISGLIIINDFGTDKDLTLKIQYAQNTTNAAPSTLRVNSYFTARRVA